MGDVPTEQSLVAALHEAMKARDMPRVYVVRGLLTAIRGRRVDKRADSLSEAEVAEIVRREVRKRVEAEEFAARGERPELVEQNRRERAILEEFLPPPLAREELQRIVEKLVASGEAGSVGQIMSRLRASYGGRFDGGEASEVARAVLARGDVR